MAHLLAQSHHKTTTFNKTPFRLVGGLKIVNFRIMELRDLQSFASKPLSDFTLIVFDETVFFHYLPYNEGNGFEFICFQQDDVNHDEIEMIVNGYACFDGIRHLYFGDEKSDNYGYFNYPKIPVLVDIMNLLNKLEKEHCIR